MFCRRCKIYYAIVIEIYCEATAHYCIYIAYFMHAKD